MRKRSLAALLAAVPLAYGGAVALSTARLHGYAAQAVDPVASRNVRLFATAPSMLGYHEHPSLADWGAQQRRIAFNILADNRMIDWSAQAGFSNAVQRTAGLIASYNIGILPELDSKARPSLVVDGSSGCLKLHGAASAQHNAGTALQLLKAFAATHRPGTYAFVGGGPALQIMEFALPPGKTAHELCTFTQIRNPIPARMKLT